MAETAPHVVIACVRANWQLEPIGKHDRCWSGRAHTQRPQGPGTATVRPPDGSTV